MNIEWVSKTLAVDDSISVEYAKDDTWILISNMYGDNIEVTTDILDKLIEVLQQAKQDLIKE